MSSFPPTIADASRLLAAGDLTAVDLTQQCLSRIDAFDGEIHAFHKVLRDESLSLAAASDVRRAAGNTRGVLDGIPLAVKDVVQVRVTLCHC